MPLALELTGVEFAYGQGPTVLKAVAYQSGFLTSASAVTSGVYTSASSPSARPRSGRADPIARR